VLKEVSCSSCKELLICAIHGFDPIGTCHCGPSNSNAEKDSPLSLMREVLPSMAQLTGPLTRQHHQHHHGSSHGAHGADRDRDRCHQPIKAFSLLQSRSGRFTTSVPRTSAHATADPAQHSARLQDCTPFAHLQATGTFEIDSHGSFENVVKGMAEAISTQKLTATNLQTGTPIPSTSTNGSVDVRPPCYCKGKFHIRCVDTLTYPRPIRKFKMLLDKNMHLAMLREMMAVEVGMESNKEELVLLVKGKPVPAAHDHTSLQELGFKNNLQVVISKVLGGPVKDTCNTEDKNKQFVGDLLFGHANNEAPTQPGSIVESHKVLHGYQVLGRTLEMMGRQRVWNGYLAELTARANERALLAALLEEEAKGKRGNTGSNGSGGPAACIDEDAKSKSRKQKKKEKEKKKKEDLARKKKQDVDSKIQEHQERERLRKERLEAEKRAKQEEKNRQLELQEKLWWEVQVKKHSSVTPQPSISQGDLGCTGPSPKQRRTKRKSTKQGQFTRTEPDSSLKGAILVQNCLQTSNSACGKISPSSFREQPSGEAQVPYPANTVEINCLRPNFCCQCGMRFALASANFCSYCGTPALPVSVMPLPVSRTAGSHPQAAIGANKGNQNVLSFLHFDGLRAGLSGGVPNIVNPLSGSLQDCQDTHNKLSDLVTPFGSLGIDAPVDAECSQSRSLPLFQRLRSSSHNSLEDQAQYVPETSAGLDSEEPPAPCLMQMPLGSQKEYLSQNIMSYLST